MKDKKANNDLLDYLASIPYGDVAVYVKRINHQTAEITTVGEETLKYVNNDEALEDFTTMVKNLLNDNYNGEVNVKLTIKNGNIDMIGIFNTKLTKYKVS